MKISFDIEDSVIGGLLLAFVLCFFAHTARGCDEDARKYKGVEQGIKK